jgi:superfamily II DNA or RNA helicase
MFTLRDYQIKACREIWNAWNEQNLRRPAVVLPTGAGKTVTFAELIRQFRHAKPRKRIVVIVHREELAQQTVDKIRTMMPDCTVGVVKAARDEVDASVVVCSAQTLARPGRVERVRDVGLVVVDECHHYAAKTWKDVLTRLGCFADHGPVTVGFTATLSRGDGQGLGSVWEDVVYQRSILRMIMDGHLCDVKGQAVEIDGLDLGKVAKKAGGDFADGSLGDALEASGVHVAVAKAYREHAVREDGTVRPGIAFAPTVRFAELIADALNADGVSTEVISGATPSEDRALIYKRYREGETLVLSNCMVLTEGFDAPWAEVAVIARPTQSPGLYTQMVGRVLRTHPGKGNALVLDVCGAARSNTLCGLVDLSEDIVPPEDGESLTEAVERVRKEARENGGRVPLENMKARDVDMFKQAKGNWLQTSGHVWFNQTKNHTYFVWPVKGSDLFRVGRFDNRGSLRDTGVWMKDGAWGRMVAGDSAALPMDFALAWADGEAMDDDPSIAGKDAPWRRRKQPPTDAQKSFATKLGITFDKTVTKGELSQAISTRVVSNKLHGRG